MKIWTAENLLPRDKGGLVLSASISEVGERNYCLAVATIYNPSGTLLGDTTFKRVKKLFSQLYGNPKSPVRWKEKKA